MISRSVLTVLLTLFFILVVAFALVSGACLLAAAMGDAALAAALKGVTLTIVVLWGVDTIVLIGALGVNAIASAPPPSGCPPADEQS